MSNISKTFGESREKFGKVFLRTGWNFNSHTPGPGAYSFSKDLGKASFKYSMRKRTKCEFGKMNTPGPGNYTTTSSITPLGKFFISGLRNSGAPKFNLFKRFTQIRIHSL